MQSKKSVLLFKAEDENDQYRECIQAKGFDCQFCPLLETDIVDNAFQRIYDSLLSKIIAQNENYLLGVVFTSKRAVAVFNQALHIFLTANGEFKISNVYFFVVGPATKKVLLEVGYSFGSNVFIVGESSGSAQRLIKFIKPFLKKLNKILFFSGENRRLDIPRALENNDHCEFAEVTVYKVKHIEFSDINTLKLANYLVFFSPSGVQSVLGKFIEDNELSDIQAVALGPSTYNELITVSATRKEGFHCIQASSSTPPAVAKALERIDSGFLYPVHCHCYNLCYVARIKKPTVNLWICNCSDCNKRKNFHIVIPRANFFQSTFSDKFTQEYRWGQKVAVRKFCKTCGILPFYIPRSNPDGIAITESCIDWTKILFKEKCYGKPRVTIKHFDGVNWEDYINKSNIQEDSRPDK